MFWDQKSGFDDCDDDCTDFDDIDNAEVGLKCFLQVTFAYKNVSCILCYRNQITVYMIPICHRNDNTYIYVAGLYPGPPAI